VVQISDDEDAGAIADIQVSATRVEDNNTVLPSSMPVTIQTSSTTMSSGPLVMAQFVPPQYSQQSSFPSLAGGDDNLSSMPTLIRITPEEEEKGENLPPAEHDMEVRFVMSLYLLRILYRFQLY